ncbi:S8 family serine peptidase [Roseburia rectibacter]|jgi:minor extracellular serine protease Vpr|uniref:S8 family peptidase n=1 Tax=Roseburia rectibacter TaxID=2763062 RepID=UPI00164B9A81|nr:S8 family peptidase [Roseburia rectibacter]UMY99078.1 S8 family serine peptidase [Roseburia rectibacter]
MSNEKIENLLNLALDATEQEREKSLDLDTGYDKEERTWEVIVKFGGTEESLKRLLAQNFPKEYDRIKITNLRNEYAILLLPEHIVELVAALTEIEYMEKPKLLFFAVNNGRRVSCINPLQTGQMQGGTAGRNDLSGTGVIVAVIDSGIDYAHPDFRNADGTTRILDLWDQTIPAGSVADPLSEENAEQSFLEAPAGYFLGTEFPQAMINRALEQTTERERYAVCPSRDISGHGTHVTGIAAGNGIASQGRYRGVAYESPLLIVKLGTPGERSFPRTTELMQAVDYCIRKAQEYGMPVVLNLSFGNNYGSHSGNSLLESYLDDMADYWRTSIITGSGNEGASAVHAAGTLRENVTEEVEVAVSGYEISLNLQIWKNYADEIAVSLIHPDGSKAGPIQQILGPQRFRLGNTDVLLYYGEPSPYSPYQEIYFELLPTDDFIDSGIWTIQLLPQKIAVGNYDMWLPAGGVLNEGTGFVLPSVETTLTIPSTAARVITVGAYDGYFDRAAAFSGRGYTRETNQVKPDLVAPGVDITSCAPGGGYVVRSGTSMATPFVSGGAALLMQWGIVNKNDLYLYGEKMKAYLIKGARRLPAMQYYPNPVFGWGALCVAQSLPD